MKRTLTDTLGWGIVLWLFGYVLVFLFFALVPPALIGWFITPIGIIATFWVLLKKIHSTSTKYYGFIGLLWALIAIVLDYMFIVLLLHPADGYYKPDVYLYYALTLLLPPAVGWWKGQNTTLGDTISE